MQGPRGLLGPKGPPGIPGPPVSDIPASRYFHSSSPVHERFHSWTPVISALASPQEALGGPYGAVHQGSDCSQTQQNPQGKQNKPSSPQTHTLQVRAGWARLRLRGMRGLIGHLLSTFWDAQASQKPQYSWPGPSAPGLAPASSLRTLSCVSGSPRHGWSPWPQRELGE